MKRMDRYQVLLIVLWAGCVFNPTAWAADGNLQATSLRCEYRVDPLGIDVLTPRLSWALTSDQRDQQQSAYRILVASTSDLLDQDQGDLWDSGQVQSDETICVTYAGSTLTSTTYCFWKVKVWDADGTDCGWSDSATWSMGLLDSSDWQGQWIGYDPDATDAPSLPDAVQEANWIWSDENAASSTSVGNQYFRRTFEISSDWQIEEAVCYVAADNEFELFVNGQFVKSARNYALFRVVSLTDYLQAGTNVFAIRGTNIGTSDNAAGLFFAAIITSDTGETLNILSDDQWKANSQESAGWKEIDFSDSNWSDASEVGAYGASPWGTSTLLHLPPPRYLRNDCTLTDQAIAHATLYVTSLGIYEFYMNGQRVSQDYFSPGWTDYEQRIYYRSYDVTSITQAGENAMGAVLGDGWFAGYVGYAGVRNHYGEELRLRCQLQIEYEDGTTQVVASDDEWKAALGPIQYSDFLHGECYDARQEMTGWNEPGFDDSAWQTVETGSDEVSPQVQAAVSEPVVVFEEVTPVSISEPVSDTYIFNMGQNFAGVVRLTVQGQAGQIIQLRYGERLNTDGTIYTENLRTATATDTYICKGDGVEVWQPYFTFHGFQYVEVAGLDSTPQLDMITGLAMSSDTPSTGTFECSDAMVNQIQQNALWTQRMNFIDVPTDCPQRDERLGWTGDAQVYINTAAYHNDVQAFFTKWITDLTDAQRSDGQFPQVAPLKVAGDDGGPAWGDAGVICPWTIYKMYGDEQLIEQHYDAMKAFVDFCRDRCTDDLLPPSSYHCYGDWLNIDDGTSTDIIYMAYFGYSTHLLAQMAEVLGKTADAATYTQLFEDIKTAFNDAYVSDDGQISGDTQCGYVLAIAYGLLDDATQQKAGAHLVRRVEECDWHLSTGFIGTKDLMLALAKIDRNDVAYRLVHNVTFPSWGFSIENGATSIWERWDGWTPEDGFNDVSMNSFAHYSFGAVCQWMFENIGGIQTDGPAFKNIVLKPQPGGELTWAQTAFQSVRGTIQTAWQLDGSVLDCEMTIPPNTTATLYLPAKNASVVTESGVSADAAEGVTFVEYDNGYAVYTLQSGSYQFQSKIGWTRSAWSSDDDSAISPGKTYTHAVNLNTDESDSTTINGIVFEHDSDRSGSDWTLSGAPITYSTSAEITGQGANLISNFYYDEPAQLTLTGLEADQDYILTFYTQAFGDVGERWVALTASDDDVAARVDENVFGDDKGCLFKYAYTAPDSGQLSVLFEAEDSADTWHHYAFSNERVLPVYLDPTPLPGEELPEDEALTWEVIGETVDPSFNLTIALDEAMTQLVVEQDDLDGTSYTPTLDYTTDYYWQVVVEDQGDIVYTSPVWSFTTSSGAEKILEWAFDESTGTVAGQTGSSEGANGTLVGFDDSETFGVSHVAGLVGNGLLLNGKDEYVDVSSAASSMPIAEGQSFAISGYFQTFDDYGPLFSMRHSETETPIVNIALGEDGVQDQAGKICLLVRDDEGSYSYANCGFTVNDGRWHNFIVTRVDGVWTLYIDGVSTATISNVAAGDITLDLMGLGTSLRWIADDWQSYNSHYRDFKGVLDEFAVWSGLLQTSQIARLATAVPPDGDIDWDLDTDLDDWAGLADSWLASVWTPVQSDLVLEDMEDYTDDEASYGDYWPYTPEDDYGDLELSIVSDDLYGQVMQLSYDFSTGGLHAHIPVTLLDRRTDLGIYDRIDVMVKKLSGCDISHIIMDFYDGREKASPTEDDLYDKGRITIDISELTEGQWTTVSGEIPADDPDLRSCSDLYQIMFSLQDGGEDTGTILLDSIVLHDESEDCVPSVGEMAADLNGDCQVDLSDLLTLAEDWLTGI